MAVDCVSRNRVYNVPRMLTQNEYPPDDGRGKYATGLYTTLIVFNSYYGARF